MGEIRIFIEKNDKLISWAEGRFFSVNTIIFGTKLDWVKAVDNVSTDKKQRPFRTSTEDLIFNI